MACENPNLNMTVKLTKGVIPNYVKFYKVIEITEEEYERAQRDWGRDIYRTYRRDGPGYAERISLMLSDNELLHKSFKIYDIDHYSRRKYPYVKLSLTDDPDFKMLWGISAKFVYAINNDPMGWEE